MHPAQHSSNSFKFLDLDATVFLPSKSRVQFHSIPIQTGRCHWCHSWEGWIFSLARLSTFRLHLDFQCSQGILHVVQQVQLGCNLCSKVVNVSVLTGQGASSSCTYMILFGANENNAQQILNHAHKWEARKLQSYPLHIAFSKMRHQISSKNCQLHILLPRIQRNRNTLHEMCSGDRFRYTLLPLPASKTSPSQTASTACRMLSMSICKQGAIAVEHGSEHIRRMGAS